MSEVYTVYIYDLPKVEFSSQKLASVMEEMAEIKLEETPLIQRHIKRMFFNGFMKIKCKSPEEYN